MGKGPVHHRGRHRWLVAAVAFALAMGRARAQDRKPTPPSFPSGVELVTVDVVVGDRKGHPVSGLRAEDFTLLEDGIPQEITTFEAVSGTDDEATAAPPPADPRVSTNVEDATRAGRTFVIVFDEPHLASFQAARGKRAVETFLKTAILDRDRVRLVAVGNFEVEGPRDVLVDALARLRGRRVVDTAPEALSDHEAMRIVRFDDTAIILRALERIAILTTGRRTRDGEGERIRKPNNLGLAYLDEGFVRALARNAYAQALVRYQETLGTLRGVLSRLEGIRGRKSVILVSEGFFKDLESERFSEVVGLARRANAALYFVNATGLEGIPGEAAEHATYIPGVDQGIVMANQALDAAGAETLAADTGGLTFKNRNDLAGAFGRIAAETRNYYLLGYTPPPGKDAGRFRKIEVKVRRSGLLVRSRKGYVPAASASVRARSDGLRAPIPLRMSTYAYGEEGGKVQTVLVADVDPAALSLEPQGGDLVGALDVRVTVTPRDGSEPARFGQAIELRLSRERRQALDARWLPVFRRFDLPPGRYEARFAISDLGSGRAGVVSHTFEVPEGSFRTSTPVLSDAQEAGKEGALVPALGARRTFREQSTLYFAFEVYGAAIDGASGTARVSSSYEVRDREGMEWAAASPSIVRTRAGSAPTKVGEVSLTFKPGDYTLVLHVKDEVIGRAIEVREPFRVEAASP